LSAYKKKWVEITASGSLAAKDAAIAALISAGSGAVIESEAFAGKAAVKTPEVLPEGETCLRASLPDDCTAGTAAIASLEKKLHALGWQMATSTTLDRDWSVAWRGGIRPVRVRYKGRGFFIHTSWSKALKKRDESEIIIDPSMAFGTGTHPTTKMCLKALLMLLGGNAPLVRGGALLDVGTGSAILMIAALKLGVSSALGLEIDPVALRVARVNLRINSLKARLSNRPLTKTGEKFSIIAANIFSEELRRLGPEIAGRLSDKGGYIVLSGILREQVPAVVSTYRGLGMRVYKKIVNGEWACIILTRCGGLS